MDSNKYIEHLVTQLEEQRWNLWRQVLCTYIFIYVAILEKILHSIVFFLEFKEIIGYSVSPLFNSLRTSKSYLSEISRTSHTSWILPLLIRAVTGVHRFLLVQLSKQWVLTLLQILLIGLNLRNGLIFLSISVFTEWHTNCSQKNSIAAWEIGSLKTKINTVLKLCSTPDSAEFLFLLCSYCSVQAAQRLDSGLSKAVISTC